MVSYTVENEIVDIEWLQLVLMARRLGLSIEDVRAFITGADQKGNQTAPALDDSGLATGNIAR